MRGLILSSFLFLSILPSTARAFPELVKHGYTHCGACHISPTGGGVLSEYGRALSKELLSTWGRKREERAFWLHRTNQRLALGGDFRVVQVEDDGPRGRRKRTIVMQRDLEAAVTERKVTVAATAGLHDPMLRNENEFLSRRHYVIYQATDEISIRAGRFYPAFGLLIPEHTAYIRRGLGWDQNMESYNIETAWQGEKWSVFGTIVAGRPDARFLNREKGAAVSVAYGPSEKYKIGASHYYGETSEVIHHYVGPYAILGFGEKLFLLTQVTGVRTFPYMANESHWGLVDYNRFDYEFYKGFHLFIAQEFSQTNFKSNASRTDALSVGLQMFPRPHFEFGVTYSKLYEQGFKGTPTDRLLLLAHLYP